MCSPKRDVWGEITATVNAPWLQNRLQPAHQQPNPAHLWPKPPPRMDESSHFPNPRVPHPPPALPGPAPCRMPGPGASSGPAAGGPRAVPLPWAAPQPRPMGEPSWSLSSPREGAERSPH